MYKCPLWFHFNIVFLRPLCKSVLTSHAQITSATNYNQVIKHCWPSLGFRYIMSTLEIKDCHGILTPRSLTFPLKRLAHVTDPELFSHCSRNFLFRHLTIYSRSQFRPTDLIYDAEWSKYKNCFFYNAILSCKRF